MYLEDKITSASMATESPVWWSHVAAGGLDVNSKHKKEKLSKKKKKKQRKNWRQTRMWNSCQIEKKSYFSGKTADSTETQKSGTSLRALRLKDPAETQNNTTEKKKKINVLLRVCWWIKAALTDDLSGSEWRRRSVPNEASYHHHWLLLIPTYKRAHGLWTHLHTHNPCF